MGHFGGIPLDLGGQPTRYPGQWKIPQTRLEEVLTRWATKLGATIKRSHRVVGLTEVEDGVRVQVEGPGGPGTLTGSYLVGCDGERSAVRQLAGIALEGKAATRELFRADVAGLQIADRRFNRLPRGLAISGTIGAGLTRVMVSEFAPPKLGTEAASFDDVWRAWQRVTGENISAGTAVWVNKFDNASLLAASYRQGRVLLAGDAAHQQMPSGGQAINFGIQDAVNLGWKLAAASAGIAPLRLLDSYHHERHAVAQRVLRNIEAQSALLLGDPDIEPVRAVLAELIGRHEVTSLLAGQISGLDVRYERGEHPLVGCRLPDLRLMSPTGPTRGAELLRAGHGLLLNFCADPARQAGLRAAAGECALRVDVVQAEPPTDAGAVEQLQTILVRPDGYTAWVGSPTADPGKALERWFGRCGDS